ncbi:MAG: hypothetical protein COT25_03180 [Candidatus Kerfeldbacteria bacterium CG08_land_8_20_14_0_20_42_7]|uniref:Beta-lactamase class A catalytic domain-containing protein n=1 Tax=Candidatus Kerfeldbacteria bacterium CG08_land_8_20_14_0_20_42_7 TaxID=2014245 RepID=A0A2H0YSE7_9BACT|nr:MAG: hypothetical protein COT25_03180 [Candidatus Kerfeldbacteria bacterium CG08_land_8_20_14_0_20_42_7]
MAKKSIFIGLMLFLFGCFFGWLISTRFETTLTPTQEVRSGGYTYINPLLECEVDGGLEDKDLHSFKSVIEEITNEAVSEKNVSEVSVYYRDLNNGPWFGIQEDSLFAPQSLLKVPVLIAYLHKAETNPGLLQDKITFLETDKDKSTPNIEDRLLVGSEYLVDELLNRMIEKSDNDAFYLLLTHIGSQEINNVHAALELQTISDNTPEDFVSVKAYASLFRILYNASYLNRDMSEYALEILSHTTYEKGLTNLLPKDIVVAHKFGVKALTDTSNDRLHDCGIIYKKDAPYLLCVMTKGEDLASMEKVIQNISLAVFEKK